MHSRETTRLIPTAILLGLTLVAIAIYFGLRSFGTAAPERFQLETLGVSATVTVDHREVSRAAQIAFEAYRLETLLEQCWEPLVAAEPEPGYSVYRVHMAFDAQGNEVVRGISELRDHPSRFDVADCLRQTPPHLKLSPIGQAQNIEFDVAFGHPSSHPSK